MAEKKPDSRGRGFLVDLIVRLLVKESKDYQQRFPHDMEALRRILRPGDVLLIEGSQRVSEVIKYLTQSSWSHVALYVGDRLLRRSPESAEELRSLHGDMARAMLVEANIEDGVCAVPLSKYQGYNLRICRPIKLRTRDVGVVVDTVIEQLGTGYNVRHVIQLMRYFFPVSLIPARFRRRVLEHAGDMSKEYVCSTQIAMAFQKVRYPILPTMVAETTLSAGTARRLGRWLRRRGVRTTVFDTGVFAPCDPMLVTPRDFDLSPYFEIVKMGSALRRDFDYKTLNWHEDVAVKAAVATDEAAGPGDSDEPEPDVPAELDRDGVGEPSRSSQGTR